MVENIFHQKRWKIFSIKNDGKYFPVENVSRKADEFSLSQVMIVSGSPLHGGFKVAAAGKRM